MENCINVQCPAYNKALETRCQLRVKFEHADCWKQYRIENNPKHAKNTMNNLEWTINMQRKQKTRLKFYIIVLILIVVIPKIIKVI